ncbi:MAG: hypothetical protein U0360_05885 [Dehalococcoidia bacterium]
MNRLRAAVAAAAVVAVGAGAAYVVLSPSLERAGVQPSLASCESGARLSRAGFGDRLVEFACTTSTQYVGAENGRHRYVQTAPSLNLRREIEILVRPNQVLDLGTANALVTDTGMRMYPLHEESVLTAAGSMRLEAIFIPQSELLSGPAQGLVAQPSRAPTLTITTAAADGSTPGVVVSSVTSTNGTGDTFRPPPEGGSMSSGDTHAGADYASRPSTLAENQARAQAFLDQEYGGSIEAYAEQWNANNQSFESRRAADIASAEQRIAAEYAAVQERAEQMARAEAEARAEQGGRLGAAVAGLQAVGEWMQQALDYFANDGALQAAGDCLNSPTNPVAQNAQKSDPQNYDLARQQLRDARSDNNWDTGVRALNTANGAASAAIPGIPGMALGVASGGSNAMLRQLQQQRTAQAVAGVTRCGSNWVSVSVAYSFSLSFRNEPPARGVSNDRGTVTEHGDGTVRAPITTTGVVSESRGAGSWRSSEDGGWDCHEYHYSLDGPAVIAVSGQATGLGEIDVGGGRRQPVQLFTLSVSILGEGLHNTARLNGLAPGSDGLHPTCEPDPGWDRSDGSASANCSFDDVPLLVGGSFFDSDGYANRADPNNVEIRSCRIDVRPTTPPTPTPTPVPAPSGCGPGKRC